MIHGDDIPQLALHRAARDVRLLGGNRHLKRGWKDEMLRRAASFLFRSLTDLTLATGQFEVTDPHDVVGMMARREGIIGCVWHERIVTVLLAFREMFGRSSTSHRSRAMISESADGEMVARLFRDAGGNCVRGSRSRGGSNALRSALEELERGNSVILTPDGPRGPRRELKDGALLLAAASGRPLVPVGAGLGRSICLRRSWDQFRVALPFGAVRFIFGDPVYLAPNPDQAALDQARLRFTAAMNQLTTRIEALDGKTYPVGKPRPSSEPSTDPAP